MRSLPTCFALALAVSACGDDEANTSPECDADSATTASTVNLQSSSFEPSCVKVAQGTLVTFNNQDAVSHTVATDGGQVESFDSGIIAGGGSFTHTFNATGKIGLHCNIHGGMRATVIVE